MQATIRDGERCSAAKAYLEPAKHRTNLKILLESTVLKILIDEDKVAREVEFQKRGLKFEVFARKEIILSAGAFNSPKILMLSGVGPKKHLENLGIKVVADLPVGHNLQDHVFVTVPAAFSIKDIRGLITIPKLISTLPLYLAIRSGITRCVFMIYMKISIQLEFLNIHEFSTYASCSPSAISV